MILLAVKVGIALLVFGVGLTATVRDTTYFLRHRALFGWSMVSMYVAMPLLAAWLCLKFELPPAIALPAAVPRHDAAIQFTMKNLVDR